MSAVHAAYLAELRAACALAKPAERRAACDSAHARYETACERASTMRLLISPDGLKGANVRTADLGAELYHGWADCTDMDDKSLQLFVGGRQIMAEAAAALSHF